MRTNRLLTSPGLMASPYEVIVRLAAEQSSAPTLTDLANWVDQKVAEAASRPSGR
jgi:hypothetical protein